MSESVPTSLPHALLADAMLGALARWLRALDLDVAYDPSIDDPELAEKAAAEDRTLLTRDRRLLERRLARDRSMLIRSDRVEEQVRQVLDELGFTPDPARLFRRCLRCNVPLETLPAEQARARVAPYVARTQQEFRTCPSCGRVFWRGSHVGRMESWLKRSLGI
jgi:hypothetical protein